MTNYLQEHYTYSQNLFPSTIIPSHTFMREQDVIDDGSVTKDYRFESVRLESFKGWPCPWTKPERLAAAGFYYTGENDKVKCFECSIEICEWQEEDDPMVDHQRWSGKCRFIRNIPCGNVPIGTDPSTIPAPVPKGVDVCGPYGSIYMPYSSPDNESREIEERVNWRLKEAAKAKPRHPRYASYAARLRSYDRWPIAISQTGEALATAGFFYTGSGDQTLCYHCGGGLKDWEPNDDPWVEHAKWFEYCPYLLLTKGIEFVNNNERTYLERIENVPFAVNTLNEEFNVEMEAECIAGESIASGSPQNSINSEEVNLDNTASAVADEASNEAQSVQTQGDKPCDKDARLCKICFNREMRIVFMPCGHLLACAECAKDMKICGVCRKYVERTVQVYIS